MNAPAKALGLTFAGNGIFGPDEYRDRVATFSSNADAKLYGPMFAAAPEMLDALKGLTHGLPELLKSIGYTDEEHLIENALAIIAKAESAQ